MTTTLAITLFTYMFMFTENIYSYIKKDNVYTKKESMANYLTGAVISIISRVDTFYYGLFFVVFNFLGYKYYSMTFVSFVTCLIVIDFFYYLLHRMKHTYNFFWQFHFVHHSGKDFNMSTYLRTSWVEHSYMLPFPLLPAIIIGINPYTVIFTSFFLFIYQFYCHSSYVKLPKFFDYILITPRNHAIHHDSATEHHNSNYGVMFSIWDRMFGTYSSECKNFIPGIKNYKQNNAIKIQTDPIFSFIKSLKK